MLVAEGLISTSSSLVIVVKFPNIKGTLSNNFCYVFVHFYTAVIDQVCEVKVDRI